MNGRCVSRTAKSRNARAYQWRTSLIYMLDTLRLGQGLLVADRMSQARTYRPYIIPTTWIGLINLACFFIFRHDVLIYRLSMLVSNPCLCRHLAALVPVHFTGRATILTRHVPQIAARIFLTPPANSIQSTFIRYYLAH